MLYEVITEKLVPLIILNALEGKSLPVYGDGGNVRDWLYVRDHCTAIWKIMKEGKNGETYNIGGNSEMENRITSYNVCYTKLLRSADLSSLINI